MSGVVRTRGNGRPIVGAKLLVYEHPSGPPLWPDEVIKLDELCTISDKNGSYKIPDLPGERGSLSVYITAEGFLPEDRWFGMVSGERLDPLMTPSSTERRVEAGASSTLSGTVNHEDGRPAEGVKLRLTIDEKFLGSRERLSSTDVLSLGCIRGEWPESFDVASVLYAPWITLTNNKGEFFFECTLPGHAKIEAMDQQGESTTVDLELGRVYQDLQIRIK